MGQAWRGMASDGTAWSGMARQGKGITQQLLTRLLIDTGRGRASTGMAGFGPERFGMARASLSALETGC